MRDFLFQKIDPVAIAAWSIAAVIMAAVIAVLMYHYNGGIR